MNAGTSQIELDRPSWVSRAARALWQPGVIFLPCLLLGAFLWASPSMEGAAGYNIREELSFSNVLLLAIWYLGICVTAFLGQRFAYSLPKVDMMSREAFDPEIFYRTLTVIALLGVAGAWLAALSGATSLIELAKTQQFNQLKKSLYENYNHLYTLRYATSLSGGYAMYRLIFIRKFNWLDALNCFLLLAAAAISARILVFQAVIFAGGLAIRFDTIKRVGGRTILLAILGLSICLVGFTWLRSAGSYRERFGAENPVVMTYLEFQRYLGGPIQASVGVARITTNQPNRGSLSNVNLYVTPSFLHPESAKSEDNSGGVGEQWYLHQIDVDDTLTTNSAFVEMYGDIGLWAFPVMAWMSFFMATVGSYFWRSDNLLCLIGCVVLYGFFELWRTYYFAAGSFTFLILTVLAAATGATLLQSARRTA
jgi:hypothetical protein